VPRVLAQGVLVLREQVLLLLLLLVVLLAWPLRRWRALASNRHRRRHHRHHRCHRGASFHQLWRLTRPRLVWWHGSVLVAASQLQAYNDGGADSKP